MNSMYELANSLSSLLKNNSKVYISFTPEVLDFTKLGDCGVMTIHTQDKKLDITISEKNILDICSLLEVSLFEQGYIIFTWNIKSFFSYAKYYLNREIIPRSVIVDLKIIERFLGIEYNKPVSLIEALNRAKQISKTSDWKLLYNRIFLPLMLKVIPSIETTPLLHIEHRVPVHSYYEIEGQIAGRLSASNTFDRGFNPHTMGLDLKKNLKPAGYDKLFIYMDFKQMEVYMLSYLSKDVKLQELLDSGKDFYKTLYNLITGNEEVSDSARKHCKLIFIQIIYGMTPTSLAKNFQISFDLANSIYDNLINSFPTAFEWLEDRLNNIENGIAEDFFGRKRNFLIKPYRVRNFSVQAPSAMFCLEKLIDLHDELKSLDAQICFNVHDGYGIICSKKSFKEVYQLSKKILQSESKLLTNFKVPVQCQAGTELSNLTFLK